ncbi:MAG: hypothetical protein IPG17_29145, partial [Sandaracinaceae bacterium]|nr:hypothetical protein [Sandaracinaceae bacterium]
MSRWHVTGARAGRESVSVTALPRAAPSSASPLRLATANAVTTTGTRATEAARASVSVTGPGAVTDGARTRTCASVSTGMHVRCGLRVGTRRDVQRGAARCRRSCRA